MPFVSTRHIEESPKTLQDVRREADAREVRKNFGNYGSHVDSTRLTVPLDPRTGEKADDPNAVHRALSKEDQTDCRLAAAEKAHTYGTHLMNQLPLFSEAAE